VAPDVVVVDQRLADGDAAARIHALRTRARRPALPIVLLTAADDGGSVAATDYLAQPVNLPLLRTRLRAWLVRTQRPAQDWPDGHPRQFQRRSDVVTST
jgi:DNA-binding response OmpR family regulator